MHRCIFVGVCRHANDLSTSHQDQVVWQKFCVLAHLLGLFLQACQQVALPRLEAQLSLSAAGLSWLNPFLAVLSAHMQALAAVDNSSIVSLQPAPMLTN